MYKTFLTEFRFQNVVPFQSPGLRNHIRLIISTHANLFRVDDAGIEGIVQNMDWTHGLDPKLISTACFDLIRIGNNVTFHEFFLSFI